MRLLKWGLPWLSMLAVSAALTYGVTLAMPGSDAEPEGSAVETPVSVQKCDVVSARLELTAVSNGWLPAQFAGYCGT